MANNRADKIILAHQREAPVQTVPLAEALGLRVYKVPNWPTKIAGMIRRAEPPEGGEEGYAIYVNANHHLNRRRFTIAHEIGHFILHRERIGDGIVEDALLRADGFSNFLEAQANRKAADILMPWHLIKRYQDDGYDGVEELARKFQVSFDAMSIRILGVPYSQESRELTQRAGA